MRPTVNCATAPHRNTAVAMPPTAASEKVLPMRSSSSFGNAIVTVLNTRPAAVPIRMNKPNTEAMTQTASRTSGAELRLAASWRSFGISAR